LCRGRAGQAQARASPAPKKGLSNRAEIGEARDCHVTVSPAFGQDVHGPPHRRALAFLGFWVQQAPQTTHRESPRWSITLHDGIASGEEPKMRAALTAAAGRYEGSRCFTEVHLWMQLSFCSPLPSRKQDSDGRGTALSWSSRGRPRLDCYAGRQVGNPCVASCRQSAGPRSRGHSERTGEVSRGMGHGRVTGSRDVALWSR